MRFTIFTLFPDFFTSPLAQSLVGKARDADTVSIKVVDIRDYAEGRHRQCDDTPYGGGAGMVMKPEPVAAAMNANPVQTGGLRIFLTPRGEPLTQARLESLATLPEIQLLCGRYEGVDQRISERYIDLELSLGDFVLNGGEVAALTVLEGVARLVDGVIGSSESLESESFSGGLLEYPHYTRPPVFEGLSVPDVLLSGDHGRIAQWRKDQALEITRKRRPDLIEDHQETDA